MRVGIVGAGQLGRMMALAGIPLGLEFTMYDRTADVPGAAVADLVTGAFDDGRKLAEFARRVDVVTFDWENVPVEPLRALADKVEFAPPLAALAAQVVAAWRCCGRWRWGSRSRWSRRCG